MRAALLLLFPHLLLLLLVTHSLTHAVLVQLVSDERNHDQQHEEDARHDAFEDADVFVGDADPHPDVCPEREDGRDGEHPKVCNLFDFAIIAANGNDRHGTNDE